MPGGDSTGPLGQGPMTGRALGYCAGSTVPDYMNPALGRGYGNRGRGCGFRGRGRGVERGLGRRYYDTGIPGRARTFGDFSQPGPQRAPYARSMTREQKMGLLREQASYFNETLEDIKKRIKKLGVQEKGT